MLEHRTKRPVSGTVAGRYRVVEALSERRGAATARAVDETTGRDVVLKRLSVREARGVRPDGVESLQGPDAEKAIELFRREAAILRSLSGTPGVPPLIDAFEERADGDVLLYTVHAWIPGRTLAQEIAAGKRWNAQEAAALLRALVTVLAGLHARTPPVVHRDLKPSNVLLVEGGIALLDFGAARDALALSVLDGSTVVGTHGYMPPEQYEGHAVPASDLYALGVTILEAMTGLPPAGLPRAGGRIDVAALGMPDPLAALLRAMTAPALGERTASATDVLRALDGNAGDALEAGLARARAFLGARMPPLAGRIALAPEASPERIACLGREAQALAERLRDGPLPTRELLGPGAPLDRWTALADLLEAGLAVEAASPRGIAMRWLVLSTAFSSAAFAAMTRVKPFALGLAIGSVLIALGIGIIGWAASRPRGR